MVRSATAMVFGSLAFALLPIAGCHTRPLPSGGAPGGCDAGSPRFDMSLPAPADMAVAATDLAPPPPDQGPPADMLPPPSSYIHCRGQGGAPQWMTPLGPWQQNGADIGFWLTSHPYGLLTAQIVFANAPGGQVTVGRVRSFDAAGRPFDEHDGYVDWTFSGPGWVNAGPIGAGPQGDVVVGVSGTANQQVYVGGPTPVALSDSDSVLVAYDRFQYTFQWATHLGEIPVEYVARDAAGGAVAAGMAQGDAVPYTLNTPLGAISVGPDDTIVVGRLDATGKLARVDTWHTGGSSFATGNRDFVRSLALDGSGAAWVTFHTFIDIKTSTVEEGVVILPADGSAPTGRKLSNPKFSGEVPMVASSPDGHVGLAYTTDAGTLALELWANAATRVWQRSATGVGTYFISGVALDAANDLVVSAVVTPLPGDTAHLSPDVGGGALIEGWTDHGWTAFGLIAKYGPDGTPLWSKLRPAFDDNFATEPPYGARLAADGKGGVYIFAVAPTLALCGQTVAATTIESNTRYVVRLAP